MDKQKILDAQSINMYKDTIMPMLKLSFPNLSNMELNEAMDYSIIKRMKNGQAYIDNNYKKRKIDASVLDILEYIMEREPIITSKGVMFMKHGTVPNPFYNLIQTFVDNRTIHKKEMFKYPKGSDMFQKYNLLQLLDKIDANGLYGAAGQYSCVFYNIYVASSVTKQGRSCIGAAILLFEALLSNNVKFRSLNEIITFLNNIIGERPLRKYRDYDILDDNITLEESFFQVMSTCDPMYFIPTEKEMLIVWEIMMRFDQEDLNRVFYKNNIYTFFDNKSMTTAVTYILQKLNMPFLNPNKPPKEIEVELEELYQILFEYVYYGHQYIDRLDRVENMTRNISIITDTDSTFVCFDAWYRYNLAKIYDVPMRIKSLIVHPLTALSKDEFGDVEKIHPIKYMEPVYDFDFYTDEIVEKERVIHPCMVVPQDGLRHSIINIMAYCVGKFAVDYMERYSKNSNSYSENRKCLLVLKNEFALSTLLNTDGKKNYADKQQLQEGNIVPENKSLDIKGLPITKSGLPEPTKKRLKQILYDYVLNTETIDQTAIFKQLCIMEKEIFNSLVSGNKAYYKPVRIKSIGGYDIPMRQFGIKAAVAYNALRLEGTEVIDLDKRNSIDIIKVDINKKTIEKIKDSNPEIYAKALQLLQTKDYEDGIKMVALPLNEIVPKWIIDFIDYRGIINDNLKTFPLESLAMNRLDKGTVNKSNILKI